SHTSGVRPRSTESYRALELAADGKFTQAFVAFRRGDLKTAEALCADALQGKPEEPEFQALMVWIQAHHPDQQSPEATNDLLKRLNSILVRKDDSENAHYYRGQLHKRAGNMQAAARDFHRVVQINPNHVDAQRELRLYFMRTKSTSSSLWKK